MKYKNDLNGITDDLKIIGTKLKTIVRNSQTTFLSRGISVWCPNVKVAASVGPLHAKQTAVCVECGKIGQDMKSIYVQTAFQKFIPVCSDCNQS